LSVSVDFRRSVARGREVSGLGLVSQECKDIVVGGREVSSLLVEGCEVRRSAGAGWYLRVADKQLWRP
jgi:hypothetical protein